MKSIRNVFETICSFENLYVAYQKARRGKRYRDYAVHFERRLEENLLELKQELLTDTYHPGAYRAFYIREPKKRLISAAPFRDRVVQHAVIDVIEPLMDPILIEDTYACRKSKGTHAALDRCQYYLQRFDWVLKCDIMKYFPSIDHELLSKILGENIRDMRTLNLLNLILGTGNAQEPVLAWFPRDDLLTPAERRHGIPIGNLTSQFFANFYLDGLDRFVKQELRCRGYVRYMDDFILFGSTKQQLFQWRDQIRIFLSGIRLRLHNRKQEIFPTKNGVSFLGFHLFAWHRRLSQTNIAYFKARTKTQMLMVHNGLMNFVTFRQSLVSWIGHASHGNTWNLRKVLFREIRL